MAAEPDSHTEAWLFGLTMLAGTVVSYMGPWFSAANLGALLFLLLAPFQEREVIRNHRALRMWLTSTWFAGALVLCVHMKLTDVLAVYSFHAHPLADLPPQAPMMRGAAGLAALVLFYHVGRSVARRAVLHLDRARLLFWVDGLVRVVAVAAALMVAASVWRTARHHQYAAPAGYLRSLPLLGWAPASPIDAKSNAGTEIVEVAGIKIHCRCHQEFCDRLSLLPEPAPSRRSDVFYRLQQGSLFLRQDARSGLLLVEQGGRLLGSFCADTRVECEPSLRRLRGVLRPPGEWVVGALVGLLFAMATRRGGRKAAGLLRKRAAWLHGQLDDRGWIRFAGSTPPCLVPSGCVVPPGAVTVLPSEPPEPATHRHAGTLGAIAVFAGTPAYLDERLHLDLLNRSAMALCTVTLPLAPLAAFWLT